jgi:hypothetical protein
MSLTLDLPMSWLALAPCFQQVAAAKLIIQGRLRRNFSNNILVKGMSMELRGKMVIGVERSTLAIGFDVEGELIVECNENTTSRGRWI